MFKLSSFLLLIVGAFVALSYAQNPPGPAGTIWIDRLNNEQNVPAPFNLTLTCGLDGTLCNTNATIEITAVQPTPGFGFAPGTAPIGGERFHYLSIDTRQPGYIAGPADQISVVYDIPGDVQFATSPGIGGTYMLLWNGPGNNNLPCHTTLTSPCALDQSCCNTGNPALGVTFGADLTGGNTQFGFGLYQRAADHDTPIIMRVWGADGRSVVLRSQFEMDFVNRNLLFLYKDFTPFPGDSNPLTQDQVLGVFQNAKAIALEIFGAIALDARLSYIRTAGVIVSKTLPPINSTLVVGDQVCYTVFIGNNAPVSMNVPGTDTTNVFLLPGVSFLDTLLTNELMLVPGSIKVTSPIAFTIDDTGNPDIVSVTFTEDLQPSDNVTIFFCAEVRSGFKSPVCRATFCNVGSVSIPGFASDIPVGSPTVGCVQIKYETSLNVHVTCPNLITSDGVTPRITVNWDNKGPAPATSAMLTLVIKGVSPIGLSSPINSGWTCNPDVSSPFDTLRCIRSLGQLDADSSGFADFFLNLPSVPCNITELDVFATITETCSNATNSSSCIIPIPHQVVFDISKDAGLTPGVPAVPAQTVTYIISYRNLGITDAEMVVLIENYPLFTTPVDSLNPGWVCNTSNRTCQFTIGTLPVDALIKTVSFTVKLDTVLPDTLTQICNTVTITNTQCEIAEACQSSKTVTKCIPVAPGFPDTGVEKEGFIARLVYLLTYFNNGTADATNVVITETIPGGSTFDSNRSDSRWVCVGTTCKITLPLLAMGHTGTALFVVNIAEDFHQPPTCWNNTATIDIGDSSALPDQSPGDNIAFVLVGSCGGKVPVECPNPCVECPACTCNPAQCNCPSGECSCPPAQCNCLKGVCTCPSPICNCPVSPICKCPKCDCDCPAKCDKIVEECGCKEIININLPCDITCPTSSEASSYHHE